MDTVKKFIILAIVIALAILLGPLAVRMALPSWGFDRDLESGKIAWRPIAGVMLERQIGENAWEQFIVDWVGPGTIQAIEYGQSETGGRERLRAIERRVAIDVARAYTLASSPDAFPVVVAQKYDAAPQSSLTSTDGKVIETPHGTLYFAPEAALEVSRGGYFGFRKLNPGDVVRLSGTKWSYAGKNYVRTGPSRDGAGSFAILQGANTATPMALDRRIEAISSLMVVPGAPADGFTVDRDPLAAAGRSVAELFRASSWTFPLPADLDLRTALSSEQRDMLSIPGSIAIGYGYAHDPDAIPGTNAAWILRCLDETEIWVPYQSPI